MFVSQQNTNNIYQRYFSKIHYILTTSHQPAFGNDTYKQ